MGLSAFNAARIRRKQREESVQKPTTMPLTIKPEPIQPPVIEEPPVMKNEQPEPELKEQPISDADKLKAAGTRGTTSKK